MLMRDLYETLHNLCCNYRVLAPQRKQSCGSHQHFEQIESTHTAFEEGASILHAHVRNEDETPNSDPEKFAALKDGVEKNIVLA